MTGIKTEFPFKFNNEEMFVGEREVYIDQFSECCSLFGASCVYMPVTKSEVDMIFGEYLGKKILKGTPINLIIDEIEEDFYPEDSSTFSQFGYVPNLDVATFRAPKIYWEFHNIVPVVEDLILYKKVDKIFEIHAVTDINDIEWKVQCRLFNYSHEEISDLVTQPEILNIEDIADLEAIKINDQITDQVEEEDIIDDSDSGDGLYG